MATMSNGPATEYTSVMPSMASRSSAIVRRRERSTFIKIKAVTIPCASLRGTMTTSTRLTAAAVLAALVFSPIGALAQAPTMDDALAAIAAYGPRALAEQGAPGMSIAITDRTHTIKILTFGYADVASKTPVGESTRFPIGSISKSMTAL